MKKRDALNIRFARNGIIVTPVHPDYSRKSNPECLDEMVFSSVLDFERWFERHTGEGDDDDRWPEWFTEESSFSHRDWLKVHVQGSFPEERAFAMGRQHGKNKMTSDALDAMVMAIDPAKKRDRIGACMVSVKDDEIQVEKIEPQDMYIDPAKKEKGEWSQFNLTQAKITPVAMKEPTEAVDALRECENVVKRFTGVK